MDKTQFILLIVITICGLGFCYMSWHVVLKHKDICSICSLYNNLTDLTNKQSELLTKCYNINIQNMSHLPCESARCDNIDWTITSSGPQLMIIFSLFIGIVIGIIYYGMKVKKDERIQTK